MSQFLGLRQKGGFSELCVGCVRVEVVRDYPYGDLHTFCFELSNLSKVTNLSEMMVKIKTKT